MVDPECESRFDHIIYEFLAAVGRPERKSDDYDSEPRRRIFDGLPISVDSDS